MRPVVNVVEEPIAEDEVGHRLFLLNPGDEAAFADTPLDFVFGQADRAGRMAWLCASHAEADQLETILRARQLPPYRLRSGGDDAILDQWAGDPRGHLVTAGRYDGLDLAGDICRLVVLPSVPAASTEFERFVMAYLGDAAFMRHRAGQRITQALGRANRRPGDWAMYVGLAPNFGTLLAQSAVRQAIPADVRPVIDAALGRLEGGWLGARNEAREFWDSAGTAGHNTGPQDGTRGRIRPGRTRSATTAGSARDEVEAVTGLWLGDPRTAEEAAGRAATTLAAAGEIEHAAFWRYVQAQARYSQGGVGAASGAIDSLRTATESGARTSWFLRLRRVIAQLRGEQAVGVEDQPWMAWDEWVAEAGAAGVRRAVDRCRAGFDGTHDQQAEALELLGRMSGVVADRPPGQSVTDTTWTWVRGRRIERRLWEVKTGEAEAVPRSWIDQVLGQIAEARPSDHKHVIGCVLTHLTAVEGEASRAGKELICLVHKDAVVALADQLGDRFIQYADRFGSGTAAERGAAREAIEPRMPGGDWMTSLLGPSGGQIVRRIQVLSLFE